jgi:hypothetical protein
VTDNLDQLIHETSFSLVSKQIYCKKCAEYVRHEDCWISKNSKINCSAEQGFIESMQFPTDETLLETYSAVENLILLVIAIATRKQIEEKSAVSV